MLRKLVPAILLLVVALPLAACTSPQAGVTNRFGTLKTMVDTTPDKVTEAAEKVAQEMELEVMEVASTMVDGKLEAKTATGKTVTVTARSKGDNVTQLAVRSGSGFGSDGLALQILNAIKEKL